MAFRKETIRQQFDGALAGGILQPGEQVQGAVFGQTGPSPWMAGAVGILVLMAMGARYGYFVVTDRRVLFIKGSIWNQRPRGLLWETPRTGVSVSEATTDARVWNKFLVHHPGADKPLRMNVGRGWDDELQAVLALLPGQ
jgi:hypothetical protein